MYRISKQFHFSAAHQLDLLPEDHLRVRMHLRNEAQREIIIDAKGDRFQERMAEWAVSLSRFRTPHEER